MSDEGRLVAGRYRLTERIGRGGMGTVWRAEDEVLARVVALKQLHAQPHLSDEELATRYERTRREARSAARVVHPNVIVVHDVVEDAGRPCIVMEYVPAGTLADLVKGGGSVPPREAARIGLGMVAALRAAHAAGVLHRDVKPGNVLLGADGRVVLTDFGIALTAGTSTLTRTGEMVGSIDYMAPERMRGQAPGPASDLWSLGATLYEALEGRPPFRRDTAMETAYSVVTDAPAPMRQAGPLAALVEALLSKDPEQRPSAERTEQELRAAHTDGADANGNGNGNVTGTRPSGSGPATEAVSPPAPGRRRRPGRRKRLALVCAVLALAAGATATALYVTDRPGRHTPAARTSPASSTTPSLAPVPDGYHRVGDRALGVSFPVPDGWKAGKGTGDQVTYTDPTGLAEITIGMVEPAGPDPTGHFADIEANTKANYPTYRRLRMQRTTFRGQPAAVWEFTFKGRAREFRAIDLGHGREGGREYDIYLSAPSARWDQYRAVFDDIRDGFATAG
ncbi:serine/threonine-protein kinase [Streptomyces sp. NPDC006739]|uniref:serine/threonine-protein kinase n=1 Tax=Streptomyces sp. NPDC006739 TaxID=3364763 RepID=UPI0036D03001